jgi:hypothetical protein
MTSEFLAFAERWRKLVLSGSRVSSDPDPSPRDSFPRSSLRDDARFNTVALELFALQFCHNAPYRRFCDTREQTPDSVEHWTRIPAVPTQAFKELDFSCLPSGQRTVVFHSSGTTGQCPSRHFHSHESLEVYEASLWPWFRRHVLPDLQYPISDFQSPGGAPWKNPLAIGDWRLAILTPSSSSAPRSSLVHMFESVRRHLAAPESAFVGKAASAGAWTLDFDSALAVLSEAAGKNHPLVLLGTAFSFVHLLDELSQRNLRFALPAGSRVMETGGYKGRSRSLPKVELHALITKLLDIPQSHIVCEYGMSELSSQAYDIEVRSAKCEVRSVNRVFRFPPWTRVQMVSPETGREVAEGETGLLRIYDLANVFSVMAIQTEDLAVRRGDGFELIGRAELAEPRGCSLRSEDLQLLDRNSLS